MNEAVTSITDFMLFGESLVFSFWIFFGKKRTQSSYLWIFFFLLIGLGSLCGALFHGWDSFHTQKWWRFVTYFIVAGITFFPLALISLKTKKISSIWLWIAVLIIAGAFYIFYQSESFLHVIIYESVALFICFVIALQYLKIGWSRVAFSLLFGLFLSVVAALFQSQVIKVNLESLNNNDIFHIIQMMSLFFFFLVWKYAQALPEK